MGLSPITCGPDRSVQTLGTHVQIELTAGHHWCWGTGVRTGSTRHDTRCMTLEMQPIGIKPSRPYDGLFIILNDTSPQNAKIAYVNVILLESQGLGSLRVVGCQRYLVSPHFWKAVATWNRELRCMLVSVNPDVSCLNIVNNSRLWGQIDRGHLN